MVHCRSPTKCLKNGHFPSNQIQIVPDSNCCKLFMDNGLPAGANFSPDTSDKEHRPKANKKRRRTNMQKKAAFPCHLKATVPCGRVYGCGNHEPISSVERRRLAGQRCGLRRCHFADSRNGKTDKRQTERGLLAARLKSPNRELRRLAPTVPGKRTRAPQEFASGCCRERPSGC